MEYISAIMELGFRVLGLGMVYWSKYQLDQRIVYAESLSSNR